MIALLLLACTPNPCESADDPTLTLGTGASGYEVADDGAVVGMTRGMQGGFHIDIALDATYFDPSDLVSGSLTGTTDGAVVAGSQPWFAFRCNPDSDTQRATGLRLIFYEGVPEDVAGTTIEVEAEVTDVRGNSATATRTWTIEDPDIPPDLPPD